MTIESVLHKYYRATRESETLLINQSSLTLQRQGKQVYRFGFGQSPFPVPEHVTLAMAGAAARKEYMSVQGDLALRKAIADFHLQIESRPWRHEDIIVGSGSKILLFCIMASFHQADVLLPAPSWVSYAPQAELAGHKVHWIPTDYETNWKITAQELAQVCQRLDKDRPKILVLNYPSNPTGQTYSRPNLYQLADVLKQHNVLVIADEIYAFLDFSGGSAHIEDYYPEGVITTSGLSKWGGAGGWRLGYAHVPGHMPELKKRIIGVASETYSCAASPIQVGATQAYLKLLEAQQFLQQQQLVLKKISDYCTSRLQVAGVKVHSAQGGFYLFPDFSYFAKKLGNKGLVTSAQLVQAILQQTGVALLPGEAFGMPADSLTARLAFVDFDGAKALSNAEDEQVFNHCKEGIAKLCQWLSEL